jgi:hypothetical protein
LNNQKSTLQQTEIQRICDKPGGVYDKKEDSMVAWSKKAGQATDSTHRKIKCASLSQIAAD